MPNVADILIDTLILLDVKRIYGIVGDSLNAITDAIQKKNKINWIGTRHEESAALAAAAEAQLTNRLAVCAGSCGPGNLHLINGLYDAQRSGAPVLAIAAHIPSQEIGGGYFQETHPELLFNECSDFCELISSPEQMPRMLTMAIQSSLVKKSVSVLVIPGDIAAKKLEDRSSIFLPCAPQPLISPNADELKQIAAILNQSSKITLLCGIGCRGAHAELLALGQRLNSPMVHTLRGKDAVEYDNAYDVGMTGFIGFSSGYYAIEECDTLLILGSSFPYRQFYPSRAKIIQVDIKGEQLGKRVKIDLGVIGDIKQTIRSLLPLLKQNENTTFLEKAKKHYQSARKSLDDLAINNPKQKLIHPQYLAKCISELAAQDAVFCCDVGTVTLWAARYLTMNGARSLLGSFNHGTMANALSQSIGAKSAFQKRQVIAMCGDGGIAMLLGDLLSLKQHNLPIIVVIFNNGTLGFVELEMKAAGLLDFGTTLNNPDFAKIAEAIGLQGIRVEDSADLKPAFERAFKLNEPVVIDVLTNRMELSMPPKITFEQIKGFSLYLTKAILNGRGNEIIELAKTNLWR